MSLYKKVGTHNGLIYLNYNTTKEYDGVFKVGDSKEVLTGTVGFQFIKGSYKYPEQFILKVFTKNLPVMKKSVNENYNTVEIAMDKKHFLQVALDVILKSDYYKKELEEYKMDFKEEINRIKEYKANNFFKPKAGKYSVVILGDPEEDSFTKEDGTVLPRVKFEVEYKGSSDDRPVMAYWSIARGNTATSLWGQILLLYEHNGSKWSGLNFTLLVKGSGLNTDYTVLEAADLYNNISLVDKEEVIN